MISDERVAAFEVPLPGQAISDYWVSHKWVLEEQYTDEGILVFGTRYVPIPGGGKSGEAWEETDSFVWDLNEEMIMWDNGEPSFYPLPYSTVANNCVEENATVVGAVLAVFATGGNLWGGASAIIAAGVAYSNLRSCLGVD